MAVTVSTSCAVTRSEPRGHGRRTGADAARLGVRRAGNEQDQTGHVWTFLDEPRDPQRITPGALVVAADEDAAAVCQVVDVVPVGDGTVVHLRLLPGLVDDCRVLADRALAR